MFESISDKLQSALRSLRGQGVLTPAHVEAALREIRLALLQADVHFRVVKELLEKVRARALGQEVLRSLSPDQAVLRVVRDEMVDLLGGAQPPRLHTAPRPPSVVLLTGLQGSGKTTTAAKLGLHLSRGGQRPLLVSTDVHRPAAREQLRVLAGRASLAVHHPDLADPGAILDSALEEARALGYPFLLVDTAGRLHIDDEMMAELQELKARARPSETLYVADAMTGQDAVRSAEEFERRVGLTGIVLTKLDGDARGGAALSAAAVTGRPVKFAAVGETIEDLEPFEATRMVGRILGLGDVLGLIEKVEGAVAREDALALAGRLRRQQFTLEDYRDQLAQMRRLGPLDQVLGMIPGLGQAAKDVDAERGEREIRRAVAVLDSMTPAERRDPSLLNGSRRKRIARGSGTSVEDVNRLLKQFVQARKLMKQFGSLGQGRLMRRFAARLAHPT